MDDGESEAARMKFGSMLICGVVHLCMSGFDCELCGKFSSHLVQREDITDIREASSDTVV